MDSNIQIQTLKSQIEYMKLQIDNISMQNNNMFGMNAPIGDQLINLSMQMLNTGIQAFNIGKTMMMNMNIDNYYEQLKKVSEQINSMINEYDMQQQQLMMQQQMLFQQQMMMERQMRENQFQTNDDKYISLLFVNSSNKLTTIVTKHGTKVKDTLKQYNEKNFGFQNDKITFLFNGKKIDKNENQVVEKFFGIFDHVTITVFEVQNLMGKLQFI